MSELKKAFEQHIQKRALVWNDELAKRVFEQVNGVYIWQGMETRFRDFQAGYELVKQGEVK